MLGRSKTFGGAFDHESKQNEILKLEKQTTVEGFWGDKKAAGRIMKLIHGLRSELEAWGALESDASDLAELASILEDDRSLLAEVEKGIVELEDRLEHKQF